MKKLIEKNHYTFIASAKTISLDDYTTVNPAGLLLITNVIDNIIIYNFASASLGGVVSGNTITLTYNTTAMSNSDDLQIFYEDTDTNAATEELLEILRGQLSNDETLRKQLFQLLKPLGIVGSGTNRIGVDIYPVASIPVTATIAANQDVRTVTTVASITNQVNMGGLNALDLQVNMARAAFIGFRNNITF